MHTIMNKKSDGEIPSRLPSGPDTTLLNALFRQLREALGKIILTLHRHRYVSCKMTDGYKGKPKGVAEEFFPSLTFSPDIPHTLSSSSDSPELRSGTKRRTDIDIFLFFIQGFFLLERQCQPAIFFKTSSSRSSPFDSVSEFREVRVMLRRPTESQILLTVDVIGQYDVHFSSDRIKFMF